MEKRKRCLKERIKNKKELLEMKDTITKNINIQ